MISIIPPVVLKDAHYMLFYLTPAIQARMLVTFDEELNPLPVTVRVGQVTRHHIHTFQLHVAAVVVVVVAGLPHANIITTCTCTDWERNYGNGCM